MKPTYWQSHRDGYMSSVIGRNGMRYRYTPYVSEKEIRVPRPLRYTKPEIENLRKNPEPENPVTSRRNMARARRDGRIRDKLPRAKIYG